MDEFGRYYTEAKISELLVSQISSKSPVHILDLGVGNGSLLNAAMKKWDNAFYSVVDIEQKNYDEALKTFQFATNIAYTNPDNYYWMGRCYEAINKREEAIDYYYKALTFDHNFPEAKAGLQRLKADKIRGE